MNSEFPSQAGAPDELSSERKRRPLVQLLVRTTVRRSQVHGLGLFAEEFILKGTVVWRFDGRVDRRYNEGQLVALPEEEQDRLRTFCYLNPRTRLYVYCGDNARYINHSEQPNTKDLGFEEGVFEGEGITIAARDIQPGEEILSDYRSFDADARDGEIRSKHG
jgi:uncharacterized protein